MCLCVLSFRRVLRPSHETSEAPEERPDGPLHRAGRVPVLAGAGAPRDPTVHLRADPSVPEGEPLHHRWIQSLPALQAVHQKVFFLLHVELFISLDCFKIIHRPYCEQFHVGTTFLLTGTTF